MASEKLATEAVTETLHEHPRCWPAASGVAGAIARVQSRVEQGGHHVDDEVVRRRYERGLRNFFRIYLPVVDEWMLLDNSGHEGAELIVSQVEPGSVEVADRAILDAIRERHA